MEQKKDIRATVVLQTRVLVQDVATLAKYYALVDRATHGRSKIPETRCALLTHAIEDFVYALTQNGLVGRVTDELEADTILRSLGLAGSNKGKQERLRADIRMEHIIEEKAGGKFERTVDKVQNFDGKMTRTQMKREILTNRAFDGEEVTEEEWAALAIEEVEEREEKIQEDIQKAQELIDKHGSGENPNALPKGMSLEEWQETVDRANKGYRKTAAGRKEPSVREMTEKEFGASTVPKNQLQIELEAIKKKCAEAGVDTSALDKIEVD